MKPAPQKIDGAKVICFAIIDTRVQPTSACQQIVGGVLQGAAAGMAICQYENGGGFYLFGCDQDWHCATDTCYDTLEEAKGQAEFEYAGISKVWQSVEWKSQSGSTDKFS